MNGLAMQIETSMSGTKAKVICHLVGSRRLLTEAAVGGQSRSAENRKIRGASIEPPNGGCERARDPCHLAVAQDGNLR